MAPKRKKHADAAQLGHGQGLHKYFGISNMVVEASVADTDNVRASCSATDASRSCVEEEIILPMSEGISESLTPNQAHTKNTALALAQYPKRHIDKIRAKTRANTAPKRKHGEVDANEHTISGREYSSQISSDPTSTNFRINSSLGDVSSMSSKRASMPLERKVSPIEFRHDGTALGMSAQRFESRFDTFGKVPWVQYKSMYAARLEKLRGRVLAQAQASWCGEIPASSFLDTIGASTKYSCAEVVVIGVTFKDLKSRGNLVEEYRNLRVCGCLPEEGIDIKENMCCESDVLWLEDQSRRIQLELPVAQIGLLSSGLVMAVRGRVDKDGKFLVKHFCLAQAQDILGMYEILHDGTWVSKGLSNDSQHVAVPLAKGTYVNVVEIRPCLDADRIRGRIEDPHGWISLTQPTTRYSWAKKTSDLCGLFGVGLYEITHEGTWVNHGVANDSPHVTIPLSKGRLVNVLEIRASHDADRIRARIEMPPGWISLIQPSTGYIWARKVSIPTPFRSLLPKMQQERQFVALLSGLFIGAETEDVDTRKRAFAFLQGSCATSAEWHLSRNVQRVIVCGGVYGIGNSRRGDVPLGLADADATFAELAEKTLIDVMPGCSDPSNLSLPQMPLHPHLMRSARKCQKFRAVTNPYETTLDGMLVLGHAGQAVQDLLRCTSLASPLEALTLCLNAHQLAPTAPDTLATQPFVKDDPFVMEQIPQLLFSGGHGKVEYAWKASSAVGSGTMCVCVPAFNQCPAVVLVNLRDPRDVVVQEFGAAAIAR